MLKCQVIRTDRLTSERTFLLRARSRLWIGLYPQLEADEHFHRLRHWGFNVLRFSVAWEAVEHAGPCIYDEQYLDYLYKIACKAGEHGLHLFIDPHQDVWSRFSGGGGAPAWTFDSAGMDITKFKETGAAITQQAYGDGYIPQIWATNGFKLAAETMFTLFFAGNDFAPKTKVNGEPIQGLPAEALHSGNATNSFKIERTSCCAGL